MTRRPASASATAVVEPSACHAIDPLDTLLDASGLLDAADEGEQRAETAQLLLFRLEDEWYAATLDHVREVLSECQVSPLPCVPEHVLGVMNLRGEVLSVTDLGRLMSVGGLDGGCSRLPAVVLQNAECATAFPVNELGEIVELAIDRIEPPVDGTGRSHATYLTGMFEIGTMMAGLVDADRVLTPIGETTRG